MTELALYWFLPSLCVWLTFRLFMHMDDVTFNDMQPHSIMVMIALSIGYPIGVVFIALILIDNFKERGL